MRATARLAILLALLLPLSAYARQWSAEHEKSVGSEAAAEVEKQWKVVKDDARQKQLDEMAVALTAVCARPSVTYTVKIIEEKEVNAFSIPGGYVYFTTGILEDVQSEHELAGVLAHEITHNTFYDALVRAEKNKKLFMGSLAAAIGALILGAKGEGVAGALAAGEYIRLGVLSKYSIDVEKRADSEAIKYLIASQRYNPVGMLTFMERLAARERHRPKVELGIYADHPDTDLRVRLIVEQLEAAGVDINRRAVTKWDPPKVEEQDDDGRKVAVLSLWGVEILRTDCAGEAESPVKRLEGLAESLRAALAAGAEDYQINAEVRSGDPRILIAGQAWLVVTPEDAAAAKLSRADLATRIADNLSAAMHKESLGRWW
jgi:Zn-dependent protease with chaperone function